MRSNSGKDEGRSNMRDPTIRDRELGREGPSGRGAGRAPARTTAMGSNQRKRGQSGDRGSKG